MCDKSISEFQIATSPSDFLALIFGSRCRREKKKASDSQSENVVSQVNMKMEGWVVVEDIKEIFDVKTKTLNQAGLREIHKKRGHGFWLGIMRIRCSVKY